MEYELPQHENDDGDLDTHMEVINLATTGITHLGETLGELPMDKDQTHVVRDSPIHYASSPTNIPPAPSSPPQALGGLPVTGL